MLTGEELNLICIAILLALIVVGVLGFIAGREWSSRNQHKTDDQRCARYDHALLDVAGMLAVRPGAWDDFLDAHPELDREVSG